VSCSPKILGANESYHYWTFTNTMQPPTTNLFLYPWYEAYALLCACVCACALYICKYVCMYVCMHVYIYVLYICMYVYMYVCIHIYTHKYTCMLKYICKSIIKAYRKYLNVHLRGIATWYYSAIVCNQLGMYICYDTNVHTVTIILAITKPTCCIKTKYIKYTCIHNSRR